ncbi:methyltransferase domain-containing protein [Helicobacter kayseriensis]|uniref:methyltransferase domain-containing protein n=1 Tax=Helicobacter kayseriensis TaxID=2905877 RepID=UPI001E2E4B7C|nr:methyltransferase domain-containing protein [Helicobacter kayseriensis]MCE3047504.1 methyltransferase domain-containing protein [Helicobacter kayseriensis]MCE3048763.1 methyltransferase domain-containing protein [Helicobacter kayseriensis]
MRLFSFDSEASSYSASCEVQKFFLQLLIDRLVQKWGKNFKDILDLGCGTGASLQAFQDHHIAFDHFIGCDLSENMLKVFNPPSAIQNKVSLICQDFNICLEQISSPHLIFSSSSLQWATSLKHTLGLISQHTSSKIALSIMTANTLKSFHSFLDSKSPLPTKENMQKLLLDFFEGEIEIAHKILTFSTNKDLILHLRNTGIMGGGVLKYKQAKKILEYTGDLEYESLIFIGQPKQTKGAV